MPAGEGDIKRDVTFEYSICDIVAPLETLTSRMVGKHTKHVLSMTSTLYVYLLWLQRPERLHNAAMYAA